MKRFVFCIILLLLCATPMFANNIASRDLHIEHIESEDIIASGEISAPPLVDTSQDFFEKYIPKKKVAIFLDAPLTYVDNETVRKLVPEKANKLFEETSIKVIPFEESMLALRTYLEDNRMIINEYYTQPLNREDLRKICKELEANYALLIKITNSAPRASSVLFTVTFKTTVTCDVRLLDNETNKYIVSKSIVKDGSTTSVAILGIPDFNNAYTSALKKALDEIEIDASKL